MNNTDKIILYADKKDCCGCGSCMNICPISAITMKKDELGFMYPHIDERLCIKCKSCKKVCGYQSPPPMKPPAQVYAAALHNNWPLLQNSASGGVFSALAINILKEGGIVYGVALPYKQDKLESLHIRVNTINDLKLLQGSKYMQSLVGNTYQQVRTDILSGCKVLFSGTPCQIAGLKEFLGKDYDNLLTAEIICHGVPSAQLFQDFISNQEKKYNAKVCSFSFRDKSKGQGMMSNMEICTEDGRTKNIIRNGKTVSYFSLFLKSLLYRESCYICPFAKKERCSDLTLGDYWGFHKEYPEAHKKWNLVNSNGVSCLLVNSAKGSLYLKTYGFNLTLMPTEFDTIAKHNEQLIRPSSYNVQRNEVVSIYQKQGYIGIETYFYKNFKKEIFIQSILQFIPKSFRRYLQQILGKLKI